MTPDFDLIVLGGGSAGYAGARAAHDAGLKVALVDGASELGGLCILRGCMPTKALLYAAEVLHTTHKGAVWGLETRGGFDFRKVMARKDRLISEFASYRQGQLADGRFQLFRSTAQFLDAHRVSLGDGTVLTGAHFLICTGSVIAPPPISGMEQTGYLTSDQALDLQEPPESLIMLGAGPVALEFAQFFSRFGTQVTLLQRSRQLLSGTDEDVAAALEAALRAEGIKIHTGTEIKRAFEKDGQKVISFLDCHGKDQEVSANEIFHGLGRRANTSALGLDQAGVQLTKRGQIITSEQMQSSVPHIYAAGDCTGPHEIVHVAIQQAEVAVQNILKPRSRRMDYRLLISVVFTEPQVASVGATEVQLKEGNIPYRSATHPFNDHGKSMIMDVEHGFVKLITDATTGEILGGACVGPHGGELIHEIVVAMSQRMTAAQLAAVPHYHPTLAEIWTYPAEACTLP